MYLRAARVLYGHPDWDKQASLQPDLERVASMRLEVDINWVVPQEDA